MQIKPKTHFTKMGVNFTFESRGSPLNKSSINCTVLRAGRSIAVTRSHAVFEADVTRSRADSSSMDDRPSL